MNAPAISRAKVGIMIDIETLGIATDIVVWEAAMISYSLDDPETYVRTFQTFLPIQPQLDKGGLNRQLRADWLGYFADRPNPRIKEAVPGDFTDLVAFMNAFVRAFQQMIVGLEKDEYIVIVKGLNFDIPILESLMQQLNIKTPWHYQTLHCLRSTMRDAGLDQYSVPVADGLVPHNALDDCKHQINLWIAAQKLLGAGRL